jgi:hypothetical protein
MAIPTLPKRPTRDVDKIGVSWLCKLLDCVEYAMHFPIGDGKTTYRRGNTVHGIPQSRGASENTGGDSYNGMFKVIDVSDGETQKLKIVDGFADVPETYSYAGDALINDAIATNIAAKEFTITGNSFIYLIVYLSTFGNIVANIEKFDAKQDYELSKSKTLISRVKFADNKITGFSQEQHGPVIGYIDGECE